MDIAAQLQSKDSAEAYRLLLLLEQEAAESDSLYENLEDFFSLLKNKSSLVRTRGFRLICAQARWDRDGWIGEHLGELLAVLDNGKGTEVRQCLDALRQVVRFLPELCPPIEEKLNRLDLSKHKESMMPLLQKDVKELRGAMRGRKEL